MNNKLFVVSGAPASGKSEALQAFLKLHTPYLAFDIDWLGVSACNLAGRDIFFDPSTWKPYAALWFDVLLASYRNGHVPVFFTPNDPHDFEVFGLPNWCCSVEWLLLDCGDEIRATRLRARTGWTEPMIEEALEDARTLRTMIDTRLDTENRTPGEVAHAILEWLDARSTCSPDTTLSKQ